MLALSLKVTTSKPQSMITSVLYVNWDHASASRLKRLWFEEIRPCVHDVQICNTALRKGLYPTTWHTGRVTVHSDDDDISTVKPVLIFKTTCIQRPPLYKDHLVGSPKVPLLLILTFIQRQKGLYY